MRACRVIGERESDSVSVSSSSSVLFAAATSSILLARRRASERSTRAQTKKIKDITQRARTHACTQRVQPTQRTQRTQRTHSR